jgi:hypothetical protein
MSVQDVMLQFKAASTNSLARAAAFVAVVVAVAGPYLMLTAGGRDASDLPWYIWIIGPVFLTVVVLGGFLMFNRKPLDAEAISISPERRHKERL